jgi:hypothetical protein
MQILLALPSRNPMLGKRDLVMVRSRTDIGRTRQRSRIGAGDAFLSHINAFGPALYEDGALVAGIPD